MDRETTAALEQTYGRIRDDAVLEALQEIVRRGQFRNLPFRVVKIDEIATLFVLAPEGSDYPQLEVFARQLRHYDEFEVTIGSIRDFPDDLLGGPLPGFPD